MTIKFREITNDKRKAELIDCLESAKEEIHSASTVSNMVILIRKDGTFVTRGTTLENAPELIAQLEVLKFDILNRMRDEVSDGEC
tara:strand:+ start:1575 stop:1829 length:255 start_codon:yes stop_codon:yes gene_type:complete